MIQTSETLELLAPALAKAQAAIEGAKKDSANPFFKSSYADLSSVWTAIRKAYTDNGFSVIQGVGGAEDGSGIVHITTRLLHSSGQWVQDTLIMKPKENTPQGIGSTITYGRRYGLAAIAGVAPEDDDGEAAQGRASKMNVKEQAQAAFRAPTSQSRIVTPPVGQ